MAKRGYQGTILRLLGARDHLATVVSTTLLAPHFLRIVFASDSLLGTIDAGPASWLRFWFPDPSGRNIEHQRAYTIVESDPETGEFTIDFVLHEPAGPASHWASNASVGDSIVLTSLGSTTFELPADAPSGYLLAGDAASIPALAAIVATIPAHVPIQLYLEEHDALDRRIPFPEHPNMNIHWVTRTSASALTEAIETRDWGGWRAWACLEMGSLRALRPRLKNDFGFAKVDRFVQAYWRLDGAMGKERSSADEH
uniref:Transmembrane ATP-binding protein ABC transporter n=1 Tax=uncultured bacterium A1Q1_fos_2059 TaxID=1256559 RepID=L7VZI8_9BACT|nr:transmembrane ATP-binding protein ABC transporter [uncultured bacterium A1Q1_fos_2059]